MATILFSNNAVSSLASYIDSTATTMTLSTGTGNLFPEIKQGSDDYFYVTILDMNGAFEIVKVTSRTADYCTIVRAQDKTTARSFPQGSVVEQRLTAASLHDIETKFEDLEGTVNVDFASKINLLETKVNNDFLKLAGGTMLGNLAPVSIFANKPTGDLVVGVGSAYNDASSLSLHGTSSSSGANKFILRAGTDTKQLSGDASGNLTWEGKNIVRSVNGVTAAANGNITITIPAVPKAYVTQSYVSGTNWYRKYSDGWIEQGGYVSVSHSTSWQQKSLVTAFTNTNYTLLSAVFGNGAFNDNVNLVEKQTSYFKIASGTQSEGGNAPNGAYWYACGY